MLLLLLRLQWEEDNMTDNIISTDAGSPSTITPDIDSLKNKLSQASLLVDDIVRKNYLRSLSELEIVPLPPEMKNISKIRLFRVTEMVYQKKEYSTYKFSSVFSAVQNLNCGVFIIADSNGEKTDFYMGVRSLDDKHSTKSLRDTLKNALTGHFPGVKTLDYLDEEAEKVFYKRLDDGILAVINVCENEFSIATSTRAGSAPLETVRVFHKIKEARQKSDYVLVIIHGGHEHYQLPSPRMKELYRFLIEVGADAVVNHHQHCYSGYEFFNGKPIVYGLGNFLFDHPKQRKSIWNEGYMAILEFSQSSVKLEQIPYIQCDDEANVRLMNEMEHKRFDDNIEQFNVIISDKNKLEQEMRVFVESRKRSVLGVFTPYMNEYVRAAASRHWLPYCLPKSKVLAMINYISCEAQRDVTLDFLQDYTGINS